MVEELKNQTLGCIFRTNSQHCPADLDHQGSCFFCNHQEAVCPVRKPLVKLLAPETCSSVCLHQQKRTAQYESMTRSIFRGKKKYDKEILWLDNTKVEEMFIIVHHTAFSNFACFWKFLVLLQILMAISCPASLTIWSISEWTALQEFMAPGENYITF